MEKYDAVIIGFGKGGKTLAQELADAGKNVALIERSEKMFGGTCINVGCIPSKSLVHSAALSWNMGGSFAEKSQRYEQAVAEKNKLTAKLRQKNYKKLDDLSNVKIYIGQGSLQDAHTVIVEKAGVKEELKTDLIFLNTGASPFIPPIPGLKESKYAYLSETLLDLEQLPKRLVIIGGGYIGMEFASMYQNFGSQVTVIQDDPVFLPREDEEIAAAVLQSLRDRGVTVLLSTKTTKITDTEEHAILNVTTQDEELTLQAEAILVATGRRANAAGLNPEAAGVELTERGAVKTDIHLRTTAPNIWAMGDVTGGLQFTYISLDDYRIVSSAVLGDGSRTTENRGMVPYSVFLDPPFSRVGLSEKEAREKGYQIKIVRLPAMAIPKAQVLQKTTGMLKAIIDQRTGQILGAHLFCEESYEMINLIKLAIDAGLPYTVLRDAIYTHPTMSEAFNDLFRG
ncbi:FAD-dependent oxidoreductase [Diplocloster modestus]|uniref:FAD-dependent oxidoreductase n=1 Tax=Diplocloster modestus TaxID=2850322 RepID=A0ABS6K4H4_9FIRM|nr:FAD-dependent oxidoreductase [Diplocloster modestus]MBU9725366.1 FAD-dependent oxidoreductase [Diplocloster modestus]